MGTPTVGTEAPEPGPPHLPCQLATMVVWTLDCGFAARFSVRVTSVELIWMKLKLGLRQQGWKLAMNTATAYSIM